FFFQAEDGIRDRNVTGVQTCALPISIAMEAEKLGRVPDDWLDNVNKMGIQLNTSAVGGGSGGSKSGKKKEREGNRMGVLATEEMAWGDPAVTLSLPG